MKRTYLLKEGCYLNLLKLLINDFGYPKYFEELVIYFKNRENFKIILTREGFRWSWRNPSLGFDKYNESSDTIRTNLRDILEKFYFFSIRFGKKGHISIAPTLSFYDKKDVVRIEIRPRSLIGEIITIKTKRFNKESKCLDDFFNKYIKEFYDGDYTKKVNSLGKTTPTEEFIRYDISTNPILNTKIITFCRENGIMNPFKGEKTYKELLCSKSNDFSTYEDLFKGFTNIELLTSTKHCKFPSIIKHKISVIIPYYNSDKTINKVLFSLKCQNIPTKLLNNLEVIIIDDNSINKASKYIEENEYPFEIEIIRLSKNHGVSHARQLGVTHSTGDILIFLDSDVIVSSDYLRDHIIRNLIINNAVFISFKENVNYNDSRISNQSILKGVELPQYQHDLRISKILNKNSIGSYKVKENININILEDSNYFKDFHGSRIFGKFDLSCMVIGHNFSIKRELILKSSPFNKMFKGWGMEDVYFGLRMIVYGNFIIPVLSSGVYHIDHPPRSGSNEMKEKQYRKNTKLINSILESVVE